MHRNKIEIKALVALLVSLALVAALSTPAAAQPPPGDDTPVVRAVMFWMSGCGHCHEVIDYVLPPLRQEYGKQLDIRLIQVSSRPEFERLYEIAEAFGIPTNRVGVPLLLIGDRALIGSGQIPAELPGLIRYHLEAGGVDFPDVPALKGLLPTPVPTTTSCRPHKICAEDDVVVAPQAPATPTATQPLSDGFALAIIILVGMVIALLYAAAMLIRGFQGRFPRSGPSRLGFAMPVLALVGLGVAGYLAYVETQAVPAVCGPIGDCNAVQNSPYAKLFGILPVGVVGALGYVAILAAWLWRRLRTDRLAVYAPLALFGMTLFGVVFSVYLTFLEPFVIGAVCAWCLTSAVIITLLMLLSIRPALQALNARRMP